MAFFILPNQCLLFFSDPGASFTATRMKRVLLDEGVTVNGETEPFALQWGGGPTLYASIVRGDVASTLAQRLMGRGRKYKAQAESSDVYIEIKFENLEQVLDEINTLIVVQTTLQQATGGLIYRAWNQTFCASALPPSRRAGRAGGSGTGARSAEPQSAVLQKVPDRPSAKIDSETVKRLRDMLDDVHRARGLDQLLSAKNKTKAAIEGLPENLRLSVLQKATGSGIRRWRDLASVLARCAPSPQIDEWIAAALRDTDTERRDWMIQVVGIERLVRFALEINRIILEDPECRDFAILAAGNLRCDANCDALISYAESLGTRDIPGNLLLALSKFKSEKTRPFLQYEIEHGSDEGRVFAAWGLGRLGDRSSIEYLVRLLDDGKDKSSRVAWRAAQALSDLFDWSLEWGPDAPVQAKERWRGMLQSAAHNKIE